MQEIPLLTKEEKEYIERFGKLSYEMLQQIELSKVINKYIRKQNKRNRLTGKYV